MRTKGQEAADVRLVQNYFESFGFTAERIAPHPHEQRPDLHVITATGEMLYCEVKSISSDYDEMGIDHSTMATALAGSCTGLRTSSDPSTLLGSFRTSSPGCPTATATVTSSSTSS
jgi:hypothetical protein